MIFVTNIKVYDENAIGEDIFNKDCEAIFASKVKVEEFKDAINSIFDIKFNKKLTVNITFKDLGKEENKKS